MDCIGLKKRRYRKEQTQRTEVVFVENGLLNMYAACGWTE